MRTFVSVEMPEEIRERLSNASQEFSSKGITLVKKEAYHITLQFLGELRESDLDKAKEALSSIRHSRFKVEIKGLSYFDQRFIKVIFAVVKEGDKELKEIYKDIDSELARRGVIYEKENEYEPHATIARVKHVNDKNNLPSTIQKYAEYEFGSFEAGSIFLKKSTPTEQGHVHETLLEVKF